MQDRYRVTLTLARGELLIFETWSEQDAMDWASSHDSGHLKGRLVEKIVTLALD